jgi:hypothetical protein
MPGPTPMEARLENATGFPVRHSHVLAVPSCLRVFGGCMKTRVLPSNSLSSLASVNKLDELSRPPHTQRKSP